jgi:outer membrane autotransporter protein
MLLHAIGTSMKLSRRSGLGVTVGTWLIVSVFVSVPPCLAQTIWTDATGDWFTSSNWSSGVPDFFNSAFINNGGTAIIDQTSVARAHNTNLGFDATDSGSLVIDHGSSLATDNVASGYQGQGTLRIANGSSLLDVNGFIGDFHGSIGSVTVDGQGSTWTNLQFLVVGQFGTGVLNITNGGAVSSPLSVIGLGPFRENSASGLVVVDGKGSMFVNSTRLEVGESATGTLIINNGGTVVNGEDGEIGSVTSSVGSVVVNGVGSSWMNGSTLAVRFGTLTITNGGAVSDSGAAIGTDLVGSATAGVVVDGRGSVWRNDGNLSVSSIVLATLQISNGGTVFSSMTAGIASGIGSVGSVRVDGAGSSWIHDGFLAVGSNGSAAILDITTGGTVSCTEATIGSAGFAASENAPSTVFVDGKASRWGINGLLTVAEFGGGVGTLNVSNGGSVSSANAIVGNAFRGRGTVSVDGTGSAWTNQGQLLVGDFGDGFVNVTNGGRIFSGDTFLGSGIVGNTPSVADALVSGSGSAWVINGSLYVGGNGTSSAGFGLLQLVDGGTVSVARNYQQNADGTLCIGIAGLSASQHGLLSVSGIASLNGTLRLVRLANFAAPGGGKIIFLTAAGGTTGQFATVVNPFARSDTLLTADVIYEPNDVALLFSQGSFLINALTPNQRAVAASLDKSVSHARAANLIQFLDSKFLTELPHDFDLIAPEELASIYEIGFSQVTVQTVNLQRRMDDIRAGSTGFSAAGYQMRDTQGFVKDGKAALNNNSSAAFVPSPDNRWGVFVTGTGQFVSVGDEDFNAHGYDITTGGVTAGIDYRVTNHFALGVSGTYAHSDADLVDGGRATVDGGKLGLFGTYFSGGLYVDGALAGGWNDFKTRCAALLGIARGETDGGEFNAFVGSGYNWRRGRWTFGPMATFQYVKVALNGFTEDGSLAPLHLESQNEDSFRSNLGLRVSRDCKVGPVVLRPELRASWQHEFSDQSYPIDSTFASGAGGLFTVHGPVTGRDSALIGAGVAVQWSARTSTYLSYDGEIGRSNYDSHTVSGGVRISF